MAESLEYTELEARYQRYREILKNLTLMSDIFMRNVLKQKECTEHMSVRSISCGLSWAGTI